MPIGHSDATSSGQLTVYKDIVTPSLDKVKEVLSTPLPANSRKPNLVPIYGQLSSDLITPSAAYLKVSAHFAAPNGETSSTQSFLFESAATERVGRYSFVGAAPRKVLTTGPGQPGGAVDPLPALQAELDEHIVAHVPGLRLPPLAGAEVPQHG